MVLLFSSTRERARRRRLSKFEEEFVLNNYSIEQLYKDISEMKEQDHEFHSLLQEAFEAKQIGETSREISIDLLFRYGFKYTVMNTQFQCLPD